jgi:NADPH:quinone reductase-like Zn-dependent oxidoreductase
MGAEAPARIALVEMQALVATDYGPPAALALAEMPTPAPGPGQVLVRMRAAALNPFDLKLLSGAMRDAIPVRFPYTPGMDGAGTVAALGEGVTGVAEGDEIFGFFGRTPGTIAQYALLDAGPHLARRPDELDAVHAAALGESGVTAKSLLRAVELEPAASGEGSAAGRSVLVIGATGGIGSFAVQLAAAAGAEVLATAGPADEDYVRALGAAHALDYTAGDVAERALAIHPGGVDTVVDLVDSGEGVHGAARALRDGGRLVSPLGGPEDLGRGIVASYVSLTLQAGDLDDLAARAVRGALRIEVSRVYPLEQAAQAFVDFAEGHTRGKLVIAVRAS